MQLLPVLFLAQMNGVKCSENGIWNPEQWIIATTYVPQSDASTLPLALQSNDMGEVSLVLCLLPAFQSDVVDVHLGELEVHLLQAFPAVSLRLLAYFTLVGDDRLHRVDSRNCFHDFPASASAFVGPVKFDLAGKAQWTQLLTYSFQVLSVDDGRTYHVLLPVWGPEGGGLIDVGTQLGFHPEIVTQCSKPTSMMVVQTTTVAARKQPPRN